MFKEVKKNYSWIKDSLLTHKYPIIIASVFLTFANFLEGIGIITVLPLIQMLSGSDVTGDGKVLYYLKSFFDSFGLSISLGVLLGFIWILLLSKLIISFLTFLYIGRVQADITASYRKQIIKSYLNCSWDFIRKNQVGKITNLVSNITEQASRVFLNLSRFISSIFQLIIYLLFSLFLNPKLTFLCILLGLIMYLFIKRLIAITSRNAKEINQTLAKLSGVFTDNIQGLKPIKSMKKENLVLPSFFDLIDLGANAKKKIIIMKRMIILFQELFIISLVLLSLYLFKTLNVSTDISEVIVILIFSVRALQQLSSIQRDIQSLVIVKAPHEYFNSYKKNILENQELSGNNRIKKIDSIEFNDVDCSFGKQRIISKLSLKIKKGHLIVIFGPSGVGKSTLIDLITGLIKPTKGKILVSGVDLANIDMVSYRKMIGYVSQENTIFNNDIKYNITLGDSKIKIKDIDKAIEFSEIKRFIEMKDGGLDSKTGEKGQLISGGERQRICIARAIAVNPQILIMDEPTSALDYETERKIFNNLFEFKKDKITIVITHRKDFLKKADHVLYLKKNS